MFLAIQEHTIKYIQETLKNLLKGDTKAKKIKKGHSNVSDSLTRTNAANSVGNPDYKDSLTFSSCNPISVISTVLFTGYPPPHSQNLLATPLAFNRGPGSSSTCPLPSPVYALITFLIIVANRPMLDAPGKNSNKTDSRPQCK